MAGFWTVEVTHNNVKKRLSFWKPNLLTQDGRDQFHSQCYIETNAANTERGSGFIGVTTDTTGPAATDTVLTSEIASGGLSRADATTKTHTDNTNISNIDHTFTASATHTNVHKAAMFDASSGGIMSHIANFSADATLVSGDTLRTNFTCTMG